MILVTGATGTVGHHLIRELAAQETPTRALVRDLSRAQSLLGSEVDLALGDMADRASLSGAMEGVDRVFLLSSPSPDQVTHQGNVIAAAKAAGVSHVVKLSAVGTAPDSPVSLGRWHAEVEQELRDSNLGWTMLHPHSFMQNLLANVPTIQGMGAIYAPMRDGRFPMIDARDVAAVAARVLTENTHAGQTYTLTGPNAVSYQEVAATLTKVLGQPVQYVDVPPEAARESMLGMGMPEFLVEDLLTFMEIFASDQATQVSGDVEAITKTAPRTLETFVRDHASLFQG